MAIRWYGLIAPESVPTGDRRMFRVGALEFRDLPLPASWQRISSNGHEGSVVVGSMDIQYRGDGGIWAEGTFLDPAIVPEVVEAAYLLDKQLIGPSVDLDPDLDYEIVEHPSWPDQFAYQINRGTVHGVTFVSAPAFSQVYITVETEEEMTVLASAGIECQFAVHGTSWQKWPRAPRETEWNFEDAINRIAEWSKGDPKRFAQAFLYQDDKGDGLNREAYRLPLADVYEGKLYLVPRAVFEAAKILSGAHGGLPQIDESQKEEMRRVITEIYAVLSDDYSDPRVRPPWQRGGRQGATGASDKGMNEGASMDAVTFAVRTSGWSDLPINTERSWDKGAALARLNEWAGDSLAKYGRAFVWHAENPQKKGDFKFPIADIVDGRLTIILNAVNNAKARLSQADIPAADRSKIEAVLNGIQKRAGSMSTYWDEDYELALDTVTFADSADEPVEPLDIDEYQSRMPRRLRHYWTRGEGAAKIRWGEPGDFKRCVRHLREYFPQDTKGLCANLHHEALGAWPGKGHGKDGHAITASGVLRPDRELFADPKLDSYTMLRVEGDHVYGHLAPWGQCHLAVAHRCLTAPKSSTGYSLFKVGTVECSNGDVVKVGKITLGTGHANTKLGIQPARDHYDDTGTCVAVVNVGEDAHGIWFSGSLVDGVTEQQVVDLRRSPLSGDWRPTPQGKELVAALAVNFPGFPILEADDALIASGAAFAAVDTEVKEVGTSVLAAVDAFLRDDDMRQAQQAFADLLDDDCGCPNGM